MMPLKDFKSVHFPMLKKTALYSSRGDTCEYQRVDLGVLVFTEYGPSWLDNYKAWTNPRYANLKETVLILREMRRAIKYV